MEKVTLSSDIHCVGAELTALASAYGASENSLFVAKSDLVRQLIEALPIDIIRDCDRDDDARVYAAALQTLKEPQHDREHSKALYAIMRVWFNDDRELDMMWRIHAGPARPTAFEYSAYTRESMDNIEATWHEEKEKLKSDMESAYAETLAKTTYKRKRESPSADNVKEALRYFEENKPGRDMESLENRALEASEDFEHNPTYETFYRMWDLVRECDSLQCEDSLKDYATKIPTDELEKILRFIAGEGRNEKWGYTGISVQAIIDGHSVRKSWGDMSLERLECLLPYMDDSELFWRELHETGGILRAPNEMSPETFRTAMKAILTKPE